MRSNHRIINYLGYLLSAVGLFTIIRKIIFLVIRQKRFSWKDVELYTKKLIMEISESGYIPDVIIGIGRGGSIIGSILSGNLPTGDSKKLHNILILGVDRMYEWQDGERKEVENRLVDFAPMQGKKVLLVASDVMTGRTMTFYKKRLEDIGVSEVKTCCLVYSETAAITIDFAGKMVTRKITMPWMGNRYVLDPVHSEKSMPNSPREWYKYIAL